MRLFKHVLHTGNILNHIAVKAIETISSDALDALEADGEDITRIGSGSTDYLVTVIFLPGENDLYQYIISHSGRLDKSEAEKIIGAYLLAQAARKGN